MMISMSRQAAAPMMKPDMPMKIMMIVSKAFMPKE
jgi:hypothetical protein